MYIQACIHRHICARKHAHISAYTYKQLAFAEEKSKTLMHLAVSLTRPCICSLSSCNCFFCCSKSNTWPSSLFFSSSVAAALHSASSLLCWVDWLSAWRRAISCRQRTQGSQMTGSYTIMIHAAHVHAATWSKFSIVAADVQPNNERVLFACRVL